MKRIAAFILAAAILVMPAAAFADEAQAPASTSAPAPVGIVFEGKLFASLKRQVMVPFRGVVTELKVNAGQHVKKGQELCRIKLDRDVVLTLSRTLSPARVIELKLETAKVDREIAKLQVKREEVIELSKQSMAPATIIEQVDRDIELLTRQRSAIREQLALERRFIDAQRAALSETLSVPVKENEVPRNISLVAPIDGHVLWIDANLREGAQLAAERPAFVVGVMSPMVVSAQVYEAEASKLKLGDAAEVTIESFPGDNKYEAKVSRISWAPLTPGLDKPSYYEVELEADNTADFKLKEGYKARVRIK